MKTVVVTGSTRGIGRGLALAFLKRDCRVVISGRQQANVDAVVVELAAEFGVEKVAGKACDIADVAQIQALWDHANQTFCRVDMWVNNAGISIAKEPLHAQSPEAISNIVATNLTGLLLANHIVLKAMHQQGSGQVWNMEGFGSNGQTQEGMCAYGATKRAVNYINKALQKELKRSAVQVCTLSPGIVVTDLLLGDYDLASPQWQKAKRIFNILGDTVETVSPFLVDGILKTNKSGATVAWLTGGKAFRRFMLASFNKRDLFADIGV